MEEQEKFMKAHQKELEVKFMIGLGGSLDGFAGTVKRAPRWMIRLNLEWLYRLMQEPGRLFKRYWHTNLKFIWEAVLKGK